MRTKNEMLETVIKGINNQLDMTVVLSASDLIGNLEIFADYAGNFSEVVSSMIIETMNECSELRSFTMKCSELKWLVRNLKLIDSDAL